LGQVGTATAVKRITTEFSGLAADSREVKPGFLFAALKGTNADGGRFIEDAVKRGASVVLGSPELADEVRRLGVGFIPDKNPRLRLARLAAEFYGAQPRCVAAVTGTNGKTSVAHFLRQIWASEGLSAASIGTIGIYSPSGHVQLSHTTPDPVELHAQLARLKDEGVDHLALEASSHGLDQFRLDGIDVAAAAFTNITRDHMDYHATFEEYFKAKLGLFERLVRASGVAVVNRDADHADEFIAAAKRRGLKLLTVGLHGETLRLIDQTPHARGQDLSVVYQGKARAIALPLAGLFQASNALVAAGLALGLGDPADAVFAALSMLKGAPGRLELVAQTRAGASVYVDYAHTPDAIETVLTALRPHVKGRLHIIFGCGGDRDRGKRPLMAASAARYADSVIVSDDNPRTEDAAAIRREVLQGAPNAREVGDRAEAIGLGIAALGPDDALVIAGKGHEENQIIGARAFPFSDRAEAVKAALALGGTAIGGSS
jgi:UDP-N-acetylmuramoyl-L-alanyl-D-glutamate--2,6-diaminopimelate ligase